MPLALPGPLTLSGVRAGLVFCPAERVDRGARRAKDNRIGRHGHALEADPGPTGGDSRLLGAGAHGKLCLRFVLPLSCFLRVLRVCVFACVRYCGSIVEVVGGGARTPFVPESPGGQ